MGKYITPTKDEIKRARKIILLAEQKLKNKPILSEKEAWQRFNELRQEIISQCKENGTLES